MQFQKRINRAIGNCGIKGCSQRTIICILTNTITKNNRNGYCGESEWMMPDEFVTIATLSTPLEADLNKLKLASEDIPVCILDEHVGSMNPIYGVAAGVRLQVPQAYAQQALDILNSDSDSAFIGEELFEDDDDDEHDFEKYQTVCPYCASPKIARYNVLFSILGVMLSFLFLVAIVKKIRPVKYQWFCKTCKEMWRGPKRSTDL